MSDFEFSALRANYKKQNNLLPYPVVVGDGNNPCNIVDPDIPGNILCRYVVSQNLFVPVSVGAPTGKMNLRPGQPVELEYDNYGKLRIRGYDNQALLAGGGSPYANVVDTEKVGQQNLVTLLPQPKSGTTISVKGWQPIVDGTGYNFPGGDLDLGSGGENVIPSAGDQAWVLIALDNDYSTLVAYSSTVVSISDLIDYDEARQECLDQMNAGATPIWLLLLSDDQSDITQDDFDNGEDQRQTINSAESSGTMSSFNVDGDSGPAQAIGNGDTLIIAGGTALSTVASATDTITVNLDDTAVTPGSYAIASLTVDQQGRLTAASAAATTGSGSVVLATSPTIATPTINGSITQLGGSNKIDIVAPSFGSNRTATWQDASGTIAYTSDITTATALAVILAPGSSTRNVIQPTGDFKALIVRNHASQTVNPFEIQNSSSTALIWATSTGTLAVNRAPTLGEKLSVGNTFTGTSSTVVLMIGIAVAQPSGASSQNINGYQFGVETAGGNASNITGQHIGAYGYVTHRGTGTLGNAVGLLGEVRIVNAGGITGFARSLVGRLTIDGAGGVLNAYRCHLESGTISSTGVPTNNYGLYIESQTAGSSTNHAIFTNSGLNRLGDQLSIIGSADRIQSIVRGFSSQTANIEEWQTSTSVVLGSISPTGVATHIATDAVTNAITNTLVVGHNSTGTAAAGFGTGLVFEAESSTTNNTTQGLIATAWSTATHASRKAYMKLSAYDTAEREAIRIEASGTAAMIGLYGATPVVQATTAGAASTFAANTSGIANDTATFDGYTIGQIVKALRNIGILA